VKRSAPNRAVASNFLGAPCPRCTAALAYEADLPGGDPGTVLVLLECAAGHRWQERMTLSSGHSGVFVERRSDLESSGAEPPDDLGQEVVARRPGAYGD
jgi:hypothetical protein